MLWLKLSKFIFVLTALVRGKQAQRRIKGGAPTTVEKRYIVYLLKAPNSRTSYDAWLCGGAIVSEWYIITSAACVEDVQHMYAIAGYVKYVPAQAVNDDGCTKDMRKKIVYTCVPKAYEFDYGKIEKWAYIDIAVVKVESAYDFKDNRKWAACSYTPAPIRINYEIKHQDPGTDAMVMGWGHLEKWRSTSDTTDYNQANLSYAGVLIEDKEECKKYFTEIQSMAQMIDKYMICSLSGGNINDRGDLVTHSKPLADGCVPKPNALKRGHIVCEEDENFLMDYTRKSYDSRRTFANILRRQMNQTRRQGICQNDHGGPLVTWVGAHEILIGVASVFRVTNTSMCTGPYLYTSTQCNGAFLSCILEQNNTRRNSDICDQPPSKKGFDMIERTISWRGHPDGPADNELIAIRPQVKLYNKYEKWGKK